MPKLRIFLYWEMVEERSVGIEAQGEPSVDRTEVTMRT